MSIENVESDDTTAGESSTVKVGREWGMDRAGLVADPAVSEVLASAMDWLEKFFTGDFERADVDVTGAIGLGPIQQSVSLGTSDPSLAFGGAAAKGGLKAVTAEACVELSGRRTDGNDGILQWQAGVNYSFLAVGSIRLQTNSDADIIVGACAGVSTDKIARGPVQVFGSWNGDVTRLGKPRNDVEPVKVYNAP